MSFPGLGLGGERLGLNLGLGVCIGDNIAQSAYAGRFGKKHVLLGYQHGVVRVNELLCFNCLVGVLTALQQNFFRQSSYMFDGSQSLLC